MPIGAGWVAPERALRATSMPLCVRTRERGGVDVCAWPVSLRLMVARVLSRVGERRSEMWAAELGCARDRRLRSLPGLRVSCQRPPESRSRRTTYPSGWFDDSWVERAAVSGRG